MRNGIMGRVDYSFKLLELWLGIGGLLRLRG
jgi:hypothetical protein